MNAGYSPVRQPLGVANPVNLPQSFGMAEKDAAIHASGAIGSSMAQLAPSLMKLGVDLKLDDENRVGYTQEMNALRRERVLERTAEQTARAKADKASFDATVASQTAELTADLGQINDPEVMNETVQTRFDQLRNEVTGANGQPPLIRDPREQESYLHYMDTVLKQHWDSMVYTRRATLDVENTKAKGDQVINQGVKTFNTNQIKQGVEIKLDAGILTPEQAKLEEQTMTRKAQEQDVARVTRLTAGGNRFVYLSGLEISEEEAERKGLTTAELAKQFGDKMINRLQSGLYTQLSSDDINEAITDVKAGVEAVSIATDTELKQAEKMLKTANQQAIYGVIDGVASSQNFGAIQPQVLTTTLTQVNPNLPPNEASKITQRYVEKGTRPMTDRDWYAYNDLITRTANYSPTNDRDGSKAAAIYTDAIKKLPQEQAYDVIGRLNKSAKNIPLGNVTSTGVGLLTTKIHDKFKRVKRKDWVVASDVATISYLGKTIKINEAEALFRNDFFNYIDRNKLDLNEASEYLNNMPIYKSLEEIDTYQQYEEGLQLMDNPTPFHGVPQAPDYMAY